MMGPSILKNYPVLKMIVEQYPQVLSYDDIKPFMTKGDLIAIASRRSKEIVRKCMELVDDCDYFIDIDTISDEYDYKLRLALGLILDGTTLSDFLAQKASKRHRALDRPSF